jgi:cell wall integrity and stress response component
VSATTKVRSSRQICNDSFDHANTKSSGSNIYQTLGLCNNNCEGKFAYAVLRYQGCWCSNEKPTETVGVDKCNQSCPGYPDQKCGNESAGLYSYVPIEGAAVVGGNGTSSTVSRSTIPPSGTAY